MRRFFTFMITLSLTAMVSLPFQTVSSYAMTLPEGIVTVAETSESDTDFVSSTSTSGETDTDNTDSSQDANTVTDNVTDSSENTSADENNSSDSSESTESDSGDSSGSDSKKEESWDSSDGPAVIESDNESSPDNPVGDDSSYYNINNLGDAPDISAESSVLMDASTGAVLYGKEADTRRYPASITKVMTALLVIENCNMDDIVTFSNEAVNGVEAGSSSAGINVGAQLTVEDTLHAMMLVSANEAAAALAEHVAGSVDAFAEMMTQRAQELGCTGTHFTNPHGLPDENHYTTAHDMALILKQAMKYDEFRKVSETITYTLQESDTLTDTLELWNHSKILRENSEYYYEYAKGSKTGFTQAALNTLVTYAKKDDTELLCIILKDYGADSSYNDTAALFRWGFEKVKGVTPLSNVSLNTVLGSDSSVDSAKKDTILSMKTSFNKNYYVLLPADFDTSSLITGFELDEDRENKRLGYITISSEGNVIGKAPVTYEGTAKSQDVTDPTDPDVGNEDDLETAPNSDPSLKPHKLFEFLFRVIIAVILIVLIMRIIYIRVNIKNSHNKPAKRRKSRRSKPSQSSRRRNQK